MGTCYDDDKEEDQGNEGDDNEEMEEEVVEEEMDEDSSDGDAGNNNASGVENAGNTAASGAGDDSTDGSQARKRRCACSLRTVQEEITEICPCGYPLEPRRLACGYGIQLGCIVRDTISINTMNLRHEDNAPLRKLLFQKLHARYLFPERVGDGNEETYNNTTLKGNIVNNAALTKMSKALGSWRGRVKRLLEKGKSAEEINTKENVNEGDLIDFKARAESPTGKKCSKWGADLRDKNVGIHHLGSGGYFGKEPIWEKEDTERERTKKPAPWAKYKDVQTQRYVRARYYEDKKTKQLTTDRKVRDLEAKLTEEESASTGDQSSSPSLGPWDNDFQWALSRTKGKSRGGE